MFVTGTALTGAETTPSCYNNQFYREKINNTIGTRIGTHCMTPTDNVWRHSQTKAVLFTLLHYNQDKAIYFEQYRQTYTQDIINWVTAENTVPAIFTKPRYNLDENNVSIRIIEIPKGHSIINAIDKIRKDEKPVSLMLSEGVNHKVRLYKDMTENAIVILTNKWTWGMCRKIFGLLPKLFPQFTIPQNAEDIFRLFGGTDYDAWHNAFNTWLESLQLLKELYKQQLTTLLEAPKKQKIARLEKEIRNCEELITSFIKDITNYTRNRLQYLSELYSLQNMPTEQSTDLLEYLSSNKTIAAWSILNTNLLLEFKIPVTYFEEESLEATIKNTRSVVNQTDPYLGTFFKEALLEGKYIIWMEAYVYINMVDKIFGRSEHKNTFEYFPQPHIHRALPCFGNNSGYISKHIGNSVYDMAIEQLIAAAKNINVPDWPVFNVFCRNIAKDYCDRKSIYCNTTKQFISYNDFKTLKIKENTKRKGE